MPRYTVEFNQDFDKLLSELAGEKGTTKAEIIRRALASYAYIVQQLERQEKTKLSITDQNDSVIKDVILP